MAEDILNDEISISPTEEGEAVDLDELQETASFLKISENRLYLLYDIDHNKIG